MRDSSPPCSSRPSAWKYSCAHGLLRAPIRGEPPFLVAAAPVSRRDDRGGRGARCRGHRDLVLLPALHRPPGPPHARVAALRGDRLGLLDDALPEPAQVL